MRALIDRNPHNAERIFPYLGGEEINTHPQQAHHRFAIDFFDRPLRRIPGLKQWSLMTSAEMARCYVDGLVPADYPGEVAADWPDLLDIVQRRVKPHRDKQTRPALKVRWWQYAEKRPGLYKAIDGMNSVFAMSRVSSQFALVRVPTGMIYSIECNIFAFSEFGRFAPLQSRLHETWARFFASTLEDRLRYTPADCFRTFPFPASGAALP